MSNWHELNQHFLAAELARVRAMLGDEDARDATGSMPRNFAPPPALVGVCEAFGLSGFERDVLVLCAGVELDSRFAALCAGARDDVSQPYATFALALARLAEPHWSALAPNAPLRRWRLIEVADGARGLVNARLRIDERVLHHLVGVDGLDERIAPLVKPLRGATDDDEHALEAQRVVDALSDGRAMIALEGDDADAKRAILVRAGVTLQRAVFVMKVDNVPALLSEREALARLWEREAALNRAVLALDCDRGSHELAVAFADELGCAVVLMSRDPLGATERQSLTVSVNRPNWEFMSRANRSADHTQLDDLAQRIAPMATWDDLVLPPQQKTTLREIAAQVRHAARVYGEWGFASKSARGLGISALFAGGSGTGKTMAAEVLANELRLDVFRIDLSAVVSKYIGETEKNLRRVFDTAEQAGAILFFDEADALFGKRSEVKDSHDRYANIEVSYLLQRMEAYRGLAILATNMKASLDSAFLRRLRFVVNFPFPDAALRAQIWERVFPAATPRRELDVGKLARLNIAGGNIRNIAVNAAFHAADDGGVVTMSHILRAARGEYAKLEKPLAESEIAGW